jgi:hypothetical protein
VDGERPAGGKAGMACNAVLAETRGSDYVRLQHAY